MVFRSLQQRLRKKGGSRNDNTTKDCRTPSLSPDPPLEQPLPVTAAPTAAINEATTTVVATKTQEQQQPELRHTVVIAGAGIVGLVLALALDRHVGIKADLYEQAAAFHDDVGAGMSMYPNGLRVIRDISPSLLGKIQQAGCPYKERRWERHDGTEVAVADESVLACADEENQDYDLQPIGIRRWILQKILYEAAVEAGITIHFNKRLEGIVIDDGLAYSPSSPMIQMKFEDGSTCMTDLLLAADGCKSKVRAIVTERAGTPCQLKYTGTTCLMGSSSTPRKDRGISLPVSQTTKCHGTFYPTGHDEQCFQFHFPVSADRAEQSMGSWGGLTHEYSEDECHTLAKRLEKEGWAEKYLEPLRNVDKALKIGVTTLEPPLESFTYGRVVLVGDAAHPPEPYLGQGAQQGLEDAGTLALLFKEMGCVTADGSLSLYLVDRALNVYDTLRVPWTNQMVARGKKLGKQRQMRAENHQYNRVKEELIQRDVFFHENSSALFPGVRHDYAETVKETLKSNPM